MEAIPLSLAVVAGGLATLNPCGFPLLPAFLTYYTGASEENLPSAPNRMAQGLLVGVLVTAGFLGLFTVVGLPLMFGAKLVSQAVPWAGVAIGVTLFVVGLLTLTGRRVGLSFARATAPRGTRNARTMVLFGVAYGVASLGCTLPIFLTLVGASLGSAGTSSIVVFAAYGVGMATVLMALSVAAALLKRGLARALGQLLPGLPALTGVLLMLSGAYLTYYWLRFEFGPRATLSSDPLVGIVTRFTARLEVIAGDRGSLLIGSCALVVMAGTATAAWQWRRARTERNLRGGET